VARLEYVRSKCLQCGQPTDNRVSEMSLSVVCGQAPTDNGLSEKEQEAEMSLVANDYSQLNV